MEVGRRIVLQLDNLVYVDVSLVGLWPCESVTGNAYTPSPNAQNSTGNQPKVKSARPSDRTMMDGWYEAPHSTAEECHDSFPSVVSPSIEFRRTAAETK